MYCQRCIRELSVRQLFPRWSASIGTGTRHPRILLDRQTTSAYTTSARTKSFTRPAAMVDAPSSLLGHSSDSFDPIIETVMVQTQQVEITSITTPPAPLVSPPIQPYHSRSRFFQYMDQKTSSNTPVTMHYTKSTVQANWLASQMKGRVIGMDLEWNPQGKTNVSLVQICDENMILLIHICNMKEFPRALKLLLEDPARIKCGVNIKNDATRLARVYSVYTASLLELGAFAQAVDHNRWSSIGINRKIISLQKLVDMYLPKPIKKGLATTTTWDIDFLTSEAKLYAANDCYAGWKVFQMLEAIRLNTPGVEVPIEETPQYKRILEEPSKKLRNDLTRAAYEGRKCVKILKELEALLLDKINRL